ncbi:hypothetical protein B0T17DRAFT_615002 [Bombardia bombarda]|uniref:Aminoglycoside phosphotransferase domain-containing protein n=1 Tax=Bombardia bombarda TaxID=252184 RepID=A0AA39X9F3_9PEZI|nr:hypothetical protein B0T17DRAFT_615002 [Bombardia bombarda]
MAWQPSDGYGELIFQSEDKSYHRAGAIFIKRELPNAVGPFVKERFKVEPIALDLLASATAIPVPKLVAYGQDFEGLHYVATEYIFGSIRGDMAATECRMPRLHRPLQADTFCRACADTVHANADKFVREVVLPQLATLRSRSTGLGGVVVPPRWVLEHDKRESWPVLTSDDEEYVFTHHDLVLHNLLIHTQTLKVLALVDMEECGYFPRGLQQWRYDRPGQFELYANANLVQEHIRLLGG